MRAVFSLCPNPSDAAELRFYWQIATGSRLRWVLLRSATAMRWVVTTTGRDAFTARVLGSLASFSGMRAYWSGPPLFHSSGAGACRRAGFTTHDAVVSLVVERAKDAAATGPPPDTLAVE